MGLIAKRFKNDKRELISYIFERLSPTPRSFADLGGVWDVNGSYTFYALERYKPEFAKLADTHMTDDTISQAESFPELSLIEGNFGSPQTAAQIGEVDAVFLFDVLLHQVNPNWDEILKIYCKQARILAIFNPQYIVGETAVRLLDLGREQYFANVPHDPKHPVYKDLFDKLDQIHPDHGRPWRDVHHIWQWGITDEALIEKMDSFGFKLQYYKNCGPFHGLKSFESHAFAFQKV